jgi:hypothetical protein
LARRRGGHAKPALRQALDAGDRRVAPQLAAAEHRLGRERQRRREGADEPFVGDLEGGDRAGPEVRLSPVELVGGDLADGV